MAEPLPWSLFDGIRLVLVDGSGLIFRAFHAVPPMTRPDGTPVNALFGFTGMLTRIMKDQAGSHIAVVFDAGRNTFRSRLYPEYKAHRPPAPDDLVPQLSLMRESAAAFGVPSVELPDWEADDLIATLAEQACDGGAEVVIVSSDKDLMQLVRPRVSMLDPMKNKVIGAPEVLQRFGVVPERVIDVQALIGDSVDNVPGVPGIGPKGAAELINQYGDLEGVLAAAPDMKPSARRNTLIEHAERARLSRDLVRLRTDVPLPVTVDQLVVRPADRDALDRWLAVQGFRKHFVMPDRRY